MVKKLVIASVFDRDSGMLLYDTQIELAENEYLNVRVVSSDGVEVIPNDGDDFDNFEGDVQGFSGEVTRVRGFQPTEEQNQPKPKKKKTKKGE